MPLKVIAGSVQFVRDKHVTFFTPTPKPMKPTPGVITLGNKKGEKK